jgi:hypothetical protein
MRLHACGRLARLLARVAPSSAAPDLFTNVYL